MIPLTFKHPDGDIPTAFVLDPVEFKLITFKNNETAILEDNIYQKLKQNPTFIDYLSKGIIKLAEADQIKPEQIKDVSEDAAIAWIQECSDILKLRKAAQDADNPNIQQAIRDRISDLKDLLLASEVLFPVPAVEEITKLTAPDAIAVVEVCTDRKKLLNWYDKESRKTVREAIEVRIRTIEGITI